MILRDYQAQAVQAVLREFHGHHSTLAVSPTGTGKLLIGAEVIRQMVGPDSGAIFMAHREEILAQAKQTIEAHCHLSTELELGDSRASEIFPAPVLLASVQSLIAGRNSSRRMHKFSPYQYSLLVIDESHHSVASSYRNVLDYFRTNPDLKILGLTATPQRADEEALGQVYESVAFDYSTRQAIQDGWLVPIEQQLISIQGLDYSHIRTTAGDLNQGDLALVMEQERNLYGICDATMRELGNRKAIMFTVSVAQAKMATDILNRYRTGVAQMASGKTPRDERRKVVQAFSLGSCQILVNCNLVSEGFDVPDAQLLVQARPTKSKLLYQQQLGRIMRPLPGILECRKNGWFDGNIRKERISQSAKPVATVMDFVGNAGRHKLVHAVDILGGKITGRMRELIERKLRSGRPEKVDELVLEAERKEQEERVRAESARKARLTAKARYTMQRIDPFDAFDLVAPPTRAWDRTKVLSLKQRELLQRQGIDPERMTYAQAKSLLDTLFYRWKNGLATLKQCACLKRAGIQTQGLTKQKASELITALKQNGWQH